MTRRFSVAVLLALLFGIEAAAAAPLSISTNAVLTRGTMSVPYSVELQCFTGIRPHN